MNSPVQEIKERLTIVDVVSGYIKLDRAGTSFKGKCPFHNEKTASFFVSPDRGTYHCFGCNKGGDIFSFIEEVEGIPFKEALTILAQKAGVEIKKFEKTQKDETRIIEVLKEAETFFKDCLFKNEKVLSYIKDRGVSLETIKEWGIGFVPDGWRNLFDHLKSAGYNEKEMIEAGLINEKNGKYFDRFRSRIIFPIRNTQGVVVGFSGRIFGQVEDSEAPKYLNSPETKVFHKSKILYGYDKAKGDILKMKKVIVVEGQFDVVLSHQAGTKNTVATSGTALTPDHIMLVSRVADKVQFCFDSDDAGIKALERALMISYALEVRSEVIEIQSGKDPADQIRENPDIWVLMTEKAKTGIEYLLNKIREKYPKSERSLQIKKRVLPIIKVMEDKIEQAESIKEVAREIGIDENSVREEVDKIKLEGQTDFELSPSKSTPTSASQEDRIINAIEGIYLIWSNKESPPFDKIEINKKFHGLVEEDLDTRIKRLTEKEIEERALRAENMFGTSVKIKDLIEDLMVALERIQIEKKLKFLMDDLKEAEKEGDPKKAEQILKKCQELTKRIGEIKTLSVKV